jgi:hypothetical protein
MHSPVCQAVGLETLPGRDLAPGQTLIPNVQMPLAKPFEVCQSEMTRILHLFRQPAPSSHFKFLTWNTSQDRPCDDKQSSQTRQRTGRACSLLPTAYPTTPLHTYGPCTHAQCHALPPAVLDLSTPTLRLDDTTLSPILVCRQQHKDIASTHGYLRRANIMGSLQVGFDVTRLPKDTTMSTPMFSDKKNNNGKYRS